MSLPPEIQQVVDRLLQEVENHPQHDLSLDSHAALYDSFAQYYGIEAKRLEALEREFALIEENSELNQVDKYQQRKATYGALAPSRNSAIEDRLQRDLFIIRSNRVLDQLLYSRKKNIPDYYDLIPELEGHYYYLVCQLNTLTATHVMPIWKRAVTEAADRGALYRIEFREQFEEWIQTYTNPDTKGAILQLLKDFSEKADFQELKGNLAHLPISDQWKQAISLFVDGNEFEASFAVFIALGDKADWVEVGRSVSNLEKLDFILFLSEKIMSRKLSFKNGRKAMDLPDTAVGNIPELYELAYESIDVASATLKASSYALGITNNFGLQTYFEDIYNTSNHRIVEYPDAASSAVKAITNTEEGFNFGANADKALDFWNWWLTEAVPQAWEFANQIELPKF